MLEPLRHFDNPKFNAIFFRRNATQIRNQGGLWDESLAMYMQLGAKPRQAQLDWKFPSGMTVKFAHLEHDTTVYNYQGSAIPLLCVARGTPILMGDNSYKNVEDVCIGDLVMTLQGERRITKKSNSLKKDCVLAETYGSDGRFIGSQVHPESHPILTTFGWLSWDDLKHLSYQDSSAKQHHDLSKSCLQGQNLSYIAQPSFEQKTKDREHVLEQWQQCRGNFSYGELPFSLKDSQNYNEGYVDGLQESRPPVLLSFPVVLAQPRFDQGSCFVSLEDDEISFDAGLLHTHLNILQLFSYYNHSILKILERLLVKESSSDLDSPYNNDEHILRRLLVAYRSLLSRIRLNGKPLHHEESYENWSLLRRAIAYALFLLEPSNLEDHYCVLFGQYGELPLEDLTTSLSYVQRLADAVERVFLSLSSMDATELFLKRSQTCHIEYTHPYKKESRRSSYPVEVGTCLIKPYGECEVFDLTVEGENHYITKSGLANENCFDEMTHFTAKQFFYMLSRNRSTSGVPGYVRGTCNPDPDSFVRELIDWWIDDEGFPIPERSGVLRWFIRRDDNLIWASSKQELIDTYGQDEIPKSLTFIPSRLTDNKILMEKDPAYMSNLLALSRVDRMRLLGGNWNVRESSGMMFQREWFPVVDAIPSGWHSCIRAWDRAGTKPSEANKDPDWTRGLKIYRYPDNTFLVADLKSIRETPGQVEKFIKAVAAFDGQQTRIISQQDPGSAGVLESENFIRMLSGYDVRSIVISKDKITRAKPVSAQCEAGNIRVLRAQWNTEFFKELEDFPTGKHDDIVDVLSLGFNNLITGNSFMDVYKQLGPGTW